MNNATRRAVIAGIGSYVPEKVLTNQDLERMIDTSDEWIVSRTGIRERHILEDNLTTSDMAVEAATRALRHAGCPASKVDLVLLATVTGDYVFPSTACIVQEKMGLTNAGAFDIGSSCSGFIAALSTGAAFVQSGNFQNVLVIGADAISRMVDCKDRNVCVIFGDGAAAVLLQAGHSDRGILSTYIKSDGAGCRHLYQPAGGAKLPPSLDTITNRLHYIKMDGRETFKQAARAMTSAAFEALKSAGLEVSDVDLMVPHQANIRIIQAAVQRMGLSMDQVAVNIDRYGNTVAASIGLALDESQQNGRIEAGDHVLLVGFGAGLTWGGIVLRWGV
ncbi:MAG: ketoacyl-ACP synthase III [Candidatus Wallbacteria bacterium]|nr:ketoacyl-ACP synthase III [Candidatus Wallbacteria bacterium]